MPDVHVRNIPPSSYYRNYFQTYVERDLRQIVNIKNINNFVKKKKIQAAEKLLIYEDFSVAELADILGFASSSHFIETFKAETGLTPKAYKEKGQFTNL